MYILIVCGAEQSAGDRRRIDLSLTCPVNLLLIMTTENIRDEDDELFVSIALKDLPLVQINRERYLFRVESLIPWLDDVSGHVLNALVQASNSFEVDFGVE